MRSLMGKANVRNTLVSASLLIVGLHTATFATETHHTMNVGCYGPYDDSIDPNRMIEIADHALMFEAFEPLIRINKEGQASPAAALSWEIKSQGKEYHFYLNPKAQWSDGQPVVARDFITGWERCILWQQDCIQDVYAGIKKTHGSEQGQTITGLRSEGPHKLIIEFTHPYAIDINSFQSAKFAPFPSHLNIGFDEPWSSHKPYVSNGLMQLVSISEDKAVLRPNPYYQGQNRTKLKELIYHAQHLEKSLLPQYVRNNIQGFCQIVDGDQFKWIAKALPEHLLPYQLAISIYLSLNTRKGPLADVEIRQMLYQAVDAERQHLLKSVQLPDIQPLQGIVPAGFADHPKIAIEPPVYTDDSKAREKLKGLALTALFPDRPIQRIVGKFLQRVWHPLGIDLKITYSDASIEAQLEEFQSGYDMYLTFWIPDYQSPRSFLKLLNSQASFASFFKNDHYQSLLDASFKEPDPKQKQQQYADAEAYLFNNHMPTIGLYSYRPHVLVNPALKGIEQELITSPIVMRFGALSFD